MTIVLSKPFQIRQLVKIITPFEIRTQSTLRNSHMSGFLMPTVFPFQSYFYVSDIRRSSSFRRKYVLDFRALVQAFRHDRNRSLGRATRRNENGGNVQSFYKVPNHYSGDLNTEHANYGHILWATVRI